MHMYIVKAIYIKQMKDLLKNMAFLLLFFIYPVLTFIIVTAMKADKATTAQFVAMFATMHTVFAPIVVGSSIVGEEKDKKTLRELTLANVSTFEYLASIGSFLFLFTVLSGSLFLLIGNIQGTDALRILVSIAVGGIFSIGIGMALGLIAKNEASVTAYSVPAGLGIAFGPFLASFNKSIYNITRFIYGQHISDWIQGAKKLNTFSCIVMLANLILIVLLFRYAFHKNKIDH